MHFQGASEYEAMQREINSGASISQAASKSGGDGEWKITPVR